MQHNTHTHTQHSVHKTCNTKYIQATQYTCNVHHIMQHVTCIYIQHTNIYMHITIYMQHQTHIHVTHTHTHTLELFNLKEEGNPGICDNMGEPGGHCAK